MNKILAITNHKGGVGKTATAINLSEALALLGRRVLLVDTDSQSNASYGMGLKPADLEPSLADVLAGDALAQDVIRKGIHGFDLLPASDKMEQAKLSISKDKDRLLKLRNVLRPTAEAYDFVIIDCPPGLGVMTINAIVAAHHCVVPLMPEGYAVRGMARLLNTIDKASKSTGVDVLGILLTFVDYRTKTDQEMVEFVRKTFKSQVFKTEIRVNTRLKDAANAGLPIQAYDPTCTGAQAYGLFAEELLKKLK